LTWSNTSATYSRAQLADRFEPTTVKGPRQLRSIVLATVSGWLAPAKESCPLPGRLGHSGAAVCCVSLD
jgi:hypothetical protein